MRVSDLLDQANKNEFINIGIYNPDPEDFVCIFDGKEYTAPGMKRVEFPYFVGKHIQKHLADHILNNRTIKNNPAQDLKEIMEEIADD